MTKRAMANKLGYDYLGKGIDSEGNNGFIVRKYGSTNRIKIGDNMNQAREWLEYKLSQLNNK